MRRIVWIGRQPAPSGVHCLIPRVPLHTRTSPARQDELCAAQRQAQRQQRQPVRTSSRMLECLPPRAMCTLTATVWYLATSTCMVWGSSSSDSLHTLSCLVTIIVIKVLSLSIHLSLCISLSPCLCLSVSLSVCVCVRVCVCVCARVYALTIVSKVTLLDRPRVCIPVQSYRHITSP